MQWSQGSIATFEAAFVTGGGAPLATTDVLVSIHKPDGTAVVEDAVPTLISQGYYTFSWDIPQDQEPVEAGWETHWTGETSGGVELYGEEVWELTALGVVTVNNAVTFLRGRVGDRLRTGLTESDLFFTDEELHTIWIKNGMDMDLATIEGWFIKMAQYAEMVDRVESGAERRMSQKFRNARDIYQSLLKRQDDISVLRGASVVAVPQAINLRKDYLDPLGVTVMGLSEFGTSGSGMYVRTYPLKRFPAILA